MDFVVLNFEGWDSTTFNLVKQKIQRHDENETHLQSFICFEHLDAVPLHPFHPNFGLDSNGQPLIWLHLFVTPFAQALQRRKMSDCTS